MRMLHLVQTKWRNLVNGSFLQQAFWILVVLKAFLFPKSISVLVYTLKQPRENLFEFRLLALGIHLPRFLFSPPPVDESDDGF